MKKTCKSCQKKKNILKGWTCATCRIQSKPSYWKERAWKVCSEYNRRKDADPFTEEGICCTCPKRLHWRNGDAGHFQGGRKNAVLFEDKGIHLQCKFCNGPGNGEQYKYGLFIERRYGIEEVKRQQALKNETRQYTIKDYQRIIGEYEEKLRMLASLQK